MAIVYQVIGAALVIIGVPLFWLPIPLGAIMILTGAALILANSPTAQKGLRKWRERHPGADRKLAKLERMMPGPLRRILEKTDGPGARDYAKSRK